LEIDMLFRRWILALVAELLLTFPILSSSVCAQSAVPVTRSKNTIVPHKHNDEHEHSHPHYESRPHATIHDATRFVTTRQSDVQLPLPTEKDAFTFAVFGDRTGGPPEGIEILKKAVADVNLFEPDLVMTVGDLVQGYNDTAAWLPQVREYKSAMGKLLCPWFPVAGNHDVYWRGENRPARHHEKNYEMHFGPLWYAFKHKNCWFIALYSDEGDPETGNKSFENPQLQRMSPEQFQWLQQTLKKAAEAEHVFLFLHHPRWLGGGYGDDWEKVHKALVEAGNVRIVFAGHIHRMRYDGPRDGIEYVTLATVGGAQSGVAPQAGFLHHYNLVTVRKQQIAMASLPVGEVMDPRKITGTVSSEVMLLARNPPTFRSRPAIGAGGEPKEALALELHNPTSRPVEFTLNIESNDHLWQTVPDHVHRKVPPRQRITEPISLRRQSGSTAGNYRWPKLIVHADYLAPTARISLREKELSIPVRLELNPPAKPAQDLAATIDAKSYLYVDHLALEIPDGPMTVECWCKARSFAERVGLVAKTERSDFGLFVGSGEPHFSIFLGDRYIEPHANRPLLQVGKWHHLAGVYDGKQVSLYVDGQRIAREPGQGKRRQNGLPLMIGADVDGASRAVSPFDGLIDGVRISTIARYQGESFQPQRRHTPDAATALLLNFDGYVGPFAYDESGHAAHARGIGQRELAVAE
jgi:hypothetical protein